MIKTNELRIGNYIDHKGMVIAVNPEAIYDIYYLEYTHRIIRSKIRIV